MIDCGRLLDVADQTTDEQLLDETRRSRETLETIRTLLIVLTLIGLLLAGAAVHYLAASS